MVYFVCETCNETLKKAQVERHLYSCKNCWGVTCVDCNFTFEGDSFRQHTSCLSEDQKYQGALYKAPKSKQKNRGVNEIWADAVQRAATNASQGTAPKPLTAHLVRMGDLGNVPRQEKKFKNFIKNSLRVFDDAGASKLWQYLDGVKNDITQEEKKVAAATELGSKENGTLRPEQELAEHAAESAKKGNKRAREGDGPDASTHEVGGRDKRRPRKGEDAGGDGATAREEKMEEETPGAITDAATQKSLAKAALTVLKKAPKKELSVKELVKQAVARTRDSGGLGTGADDKTLKRALRQRLKRGEVRRVRVQGNMAAYNKETAVVGS